MLQLFFASDGVADVFISFSIDQPGEAMAGGERVAGAGMVLCDAVDQVRRDADI